MMRISTHILDLVLGTPASGVVVRLEIQDASGEWRGLGAANTNQDGRCAQLLPEDTGPHPGIYRLVFDTGQYYAAQQIAPLYPYVEVIFRVRSGESHFHIPLLLSPNGYTTYRGS